MSYVDAINAAMAVGDVINVNGPSVPVDLRDKYFRVEAVDEDGTVTLSLPYYDKEMTRRYVPDRKKGQR